MVAPRTGLRARARKAALATVPPLRRLVVERDEATKERNSLRNEVASTTYRAHSLIQENERLVRTAVESAVARETPGDLGYIFVIAYGRSGSTLLQGILCSIPGYLVRGENSAALYRLYQYHRQLVKAKERIPPWRQLTGENSWYGIERYEPDTALAGMRTLVVQTLLHPAADTRVTGFKEIRWWYRDWREYLTFLQALFPGARFVLNTRSHDAVVQSKWWAADPDESAVKLANREAQMIEMEAFLGAAAYHVHFDDYVADPGVLAGLFEWLGETFDRDAVEAVLAVKHSS